MSVAADPAVDSAVRAIEPVRDFLRQERQERVDMLGSLQALLRVAEQAGLENTR